MVDFMIGTSAYGNANVKLLKDAGIGWIRHHFGFPFEDRLEGKISKHYLKYKEEAKKLVSKGLRIMGGTPGLGIATFQHEKDGRLRMIWRDGLPKWFGKSGSKKFLKNYELTCQWMADDLRGIADAWQIANELDIYQFRGPINLSQACELVVYGAKGLKAGNPDSIVGTNSAGTDKAHFLYGRLFPRDDGLLDYCGIDHYYGTWCPGKPQDWAAEIADIHAITGAPILASEWGFSSAGGGITDDERKSGKAVCELKKWHHSWGPGHTPEGQAQFVQEAFNAFSKHRDAMMGLFFYRWEDQANCWQCGEPDCPAETAWGLVDLKGCPKPAYTAFRDGVRRLFKS